MAGAPRLKVMADASEKRGRLLTVLGWYVIAVAIAGLFMTVLRDLPSEIALEPDALGPTGVGPLSCDWNLATDLG